MSSHLLLADATLLVDIIRRLRHKPIGNIDYVAYPGVKFHEATEVATPLFPAVRLRPLLQELIDDGTLCCWGQFLQYNPYNKSERALGVWNKGLVNWFHDDAKLTSGQFFTHAGTPLIRPKDQLALNKMNEKPHARLYLKHLYVIADGLPKSIQDDIRLNHIAFDRNTFPLAAT